MMAEMRLIDAIKLDRKIGELYTTVHYTGKTDDPIIDHRINLTDYLKGYENGIIAASRIMRSAEKVDAVPVVRCKECKRFVDDKEAYVTYCNKELQMLYARPDDFCSHGERRDNGNL